MNKGTILVVDDEEVIRNIIVSILEVNQDYRLLTASNGKEALDKCAEEEIDLIFTDLRMPVMDGMTLLSELRNRGDETPVVIVTAYGDREDVIRALRLGASNFLLKPNEIKIVLSLADRILRVRQKAILEKMVFDYLIDEHQTYRIPSDLQYTLPLIDLITEKVVRIGICGQTDLMNLRIALDEALVNAIVHGNLEISSNEKGNTLKELIQFNDLVKERSQQEPFFNRMVDVQTRLTTQEATFSITDEGKGFDWKAIPTSFDDVNIFSSHGRGLILINAIMHKVEFNEKGNQITMTKYTNPPPGSAMNTLH